MSRHLLAAAALGLSALPAAAGGNGCAGDCYRQTYVPPSYGTVAEKVMVRAPRTYALTTPARYGQVQETVMLSQGGRHWSVTTDHYGNKVGCWVTTPARYGTVTRTVMVEAPQVVPYSEPAQYGYRTQTVMTSPGYRAWTPVGSAGGGYAAGYAGGTDEGFGGGLVGGVVGGVSEVAGQGFGALGFGSRRGYGYGRDGYDRSGFGRGGYDRGGYDRGGDRAGFIRGATLRPGSSHAVRPRSAPGHYTGY